MVFTRQGAHRDEGADGPQPAAQPITVAVCDGHAVVREGLLAILEAAGDFAVVACTATAAELIDAVDHTPIDCAIFELHLPDRNGSEVIAELAARHPDTKLVVFTTLERALSGVACLDAGADGVIPKRASPTDLLDALRTICRGQIVASPEVVTALVRRGHVPDPCARLSPREREVFLRVAGGSRVRDVAAAMHLDQRTISTHLRHVLAKLGVSSTAALVAYAIDHGLVEPLDVLQQGAPAARPAG